MSKLREEIAKTDAYDSLLIRLSQNPEVLAAALHWREERSSTQMPQVRPFDGSDASAEAVYFLLEAMLRIEKLRTELSVVVREEDPDLSTRMAQSHVTQAEVLSARLAETLVSAHVMVHGVGLAPRSESRRPSRSPGPPGRFGRPKRVPLT